MCEFLDYRVVSLKRIRIMNINLDIPLGKWRYFSSDELQELNRLVETSVKTYKEEIDSDTE
jgi:23S rRNA pseudouridine2604 synthase